ncbi:MAG: uroporphyrinogen decarboxylase family protein [Candidatus Latescibacterota bacterium]
MNRRERFLTAVRKGIPDRVPLFDFLFQQPLYERLIGRRPESYNGPDAVKLALALDHDGVWLPFGGFQGYQPEFLSESIYRDEWGTIFQKSESSWPIDAPIEYPIKSRADLSRYRPPDPTLPGRSAEIEAARGKENDNLAITGGVQGPLTTAWLLMGYENICYALYDDPGLLGEVFRISNSFFKEAARRSVEAGCDAIWVSEDLGSSSAGFFSIEHYRRHVLPPFIELVDYVHNLGVPALLHACGRITEYLDDLARTKIASLHPLQRTAGMDLRAVKEKYGDRFCIIGNIDSSRVLPYGSPEDVAAQVREAIDIAAPGGGYILASDHSLHDGIPVENIVEMFRAGAEYGRGIYER